MTFFPRGSSAVAALLTLLTTVTDLHAQTGGAAAAAARVSPAAIRAYIGFLSDDALEGRGTGTRGGLVAAKFIAAQFRRMGLEPAGDSGTYLQAVPLLMGCATRSGCFHRPGCNRTI